MVILQRNLAANLLRMMKYLFDGPILLRGEGAPPLSIAICDKVDLLYMIYSSVWAASEALVATAV